MQKCDKEKVIKRVRRIKWRLWWEDKKKDNPHKKEHKEGDEGQKGRRKAHQLYFPDIKFKYLIFF